MKSLIQAVVVAAVLAVPAVSFAQSNAPQQNATASGYGGAADGTSASSSHRALRSFDRVVHRVDNTIRSSIRPDANNGMKPVYFGS
ncbi:hypothetical protein ABH944_002948 [Caballeronia udeis]|jgi:hypothetical protein|uniref:DUF680 domain-containing protein n=1 Tax=Caballeronia udeis TaxID=1232866 RepID=A0ABW8MGM8_9BURK